MSSYFTIHTQTQIIIVIAGKWEWEQPTEWHKAWFNFVGVCDFSYFVLYHDAFVHCIHSFILVMWVVFRSFCFFAMEISCVCRFYVIVRHATKTNRFQWFMQTTIKKQCSCCCCCCCACEPTSNNCFLLCSRSTKVKCECTHRLCNEFEQVWSAL